MKIVLTCVVCKKFLTGKQSRFCSTKCKASIYQYYPSQKKRGLKRKLHFVMELGGKCSHCGYDKNLAALAFHHLHGKEFQLDMRAFSNSTLDRIRNELSKCKLLCHNCHAQVHNPSLDLAKLLIEPTALTTELHPRM
jgi:hypothetical protein